LEAKEIDYNKEEEQEYEEKEKENEEEEEEIECQDTQTPSRFVQKYNLEHLILGDKNAQTLTRKNLANNIGQVNLSLVSKIEHKCFS